jgi:alkylhydroperoxidase family enzyme
MARLPFLQQSDLAPEHRDLLAGEVINLNRVLAHGPKAMRKLSALAMHIRHDSRLDPRLRELAILQVGYTTRSPYEYSHHVRLGLQYGVSEDDVRAIAEETAGRPSSLRAARELTRGTALSDETFAALSGAFDTECLLELIIAIAQYNAVVRILGSLQVDVEESYRHYLDEFPLPGA